MSKQEPQLGVDRWLARTRVPAGALLATEDFATGTSPGEILEDDAGALPGVRRTRVTYLGGDRCIHAESLYHPERPLTVEEGRSSGNARDLLRSSRPPSLADRTPLWQVMDTRVVCVRADVGTDSLTAMLFSCDLHSVPVVDDVGRPVGVVSRSDLLRHRREGEAEPPLRLAGPYGGHGDYLGPGFHADVAAELVADVMMCLAFSLPETASLSRAAAVMAYEGVHQIPVVASDGKVVGLISSLDVVRWLAQHDGYLVPGPPASG